MRFRTEYALVAVALFGTVFHGPSAPAQLTYRPGQEYRSVNTAYFEIAIQKNGRIDVALSSKQPVFENAFPMVWFADEKSPEELPIDGRWSQRISVEDQFGAGNGMTLQKDVGEWTLRTYPMQPFMLVQAAYTNRGKKPVQIAQLVPWAVGDPIDGGVDLGGPAVEARYLARRPGGRHAQGQGTVGGVETLAVYHPKTGRSLVAGFVSSEGGMNRIAIGTDPDGKREEFVSFRAETVFDPPVMIEPGERITSGVLYLGIAERNALTGLERYATAVAVAGRDNLPDDLWLEYAQVTSFSASYAEIARSWYRIGRLDPPPLVAVGPEPIRTEPVQTLAALTANALLGGALRVEDSGWTREELTAIDRFRPATRSPARPADVFTDRAPRLLHMPIEKGGQSTTLLAVFDWGEIPDGREVIVPFGALGLEKSGFYAVYDVWGEEYLGVAAEVLTVTPPAGGVRLLSLRPWKNRPMVLAANQHFTAGAYSVGQLDWDVVANRYSGVVDAPAGTECRISFLIPEDFNVSGFDASSGTPGFTMRDRVAVLSFTPETSGEHSWWLDFVK